jgi:hypothetical protein
MKVMYDKDEKELVLFVPTKDVGIDDGTIEALLIGSLQSIREDIEQSPLTNEQFPDKQALLSACRLIIEYCTTPAEEMINEDQDHP